MADWDYTHSYTELRYIYRDEYAGRFNEHKNRLTTFPELVCNGSPVRLLLNDALRSRILRLQKSLDACDIDKRSTEVFVREGLKAIIVESVASTAIEGANTTIVKSVALANGDAPKTLSERMTLGNIMALNKVWNGFTVDEPSVIGLWRLLTDGARENESIMGEGYRVGELVVGKYTPPIATDVPKYMRGLYRFLRSEFALLNPWLASMLAHFYFAWVHPFCDGNGRMARLLAFLLLRNAPSTSKMRFISLSDGINDTRSRYYLALEHSENKLNDVTYFVNYCLDVAEAQVYKASQAFFVDLPKLNARQTDFMSRKPNDTLVVSAKWYARKFAVSEPTARSDLNDLLSRSLVSRKKNKENVFMYSRSSVYNKQC